MTRAFHVAWVEDTEEWNGNYVEGKVLGMV
jgi:hypothetical protein